MQILAFTKSDKVSKIICLILIILNSCSTIKSKTIENKYETNFTILESPAEYIRVDKIEAKDDHIFVKITNTSSDIVKIIWENTSLNENNIVAKKEDIELISSLANYKKKYQEFFIGPETSLEFTAYQIDILDFAEKTRIQENNLIKLIKYPAILKLSIMKSNHAYKKTIDILVTRIVNNKKN